MFPFSSMNRFAHDRRSLTAVVLVVVLLIVVVPTCTMIGCSIQMGPNGSMPISMHLGTRLGDVPRLHSTCGGELVASPTLQSIPPSGAEALLLALAAALIIGIVLMAPRVSFLPLQVAYAHHPPPRPLDPLGQRILI